MTAPSTIDLSTLDGTTGFRLVGMATGDAAGRSVASAGDVNGDGFDDMIIGAPGADPNGSQSGSVYVVFGKAGGFGASLSLGSLDGMNGFRLDGVAAGDTAGQSVSSAGDVNGDGFDDLMVGAPSAGPNGSALGTTYVVFGKAGGFGASLDLGSLDGTTGFRLNGLGAYEQAGFTVAPAGDVNGDDLDDMMIAAPGSGLAGYFFGSAYVVFGKADGFTAILNPTSLNGTNGFRLDGALGFESLGTSLASAGDVNGDGFLDFVVGAGTADQTGLYSGSAYVVFGKAGGLDTSLSLGSLDGTNGFRLDGVAAGDRVGWSVDSAGDVNGDGFDDIIVGARYADPNGSDSSAAYVVFGADGGFAANVNVGDLDGTNGFRLEGAAAGDNAGWSVASAGDLNADGIDDVVVGAYKADPNGGDSGAVYVVFGQTGGFGASLNLGSLDGTNGFRLAGVLADDRVGWSVASAGDVNGDGGADLIIGAPFADASGFFGAAYVVFGVAPLSPGETLVGTEGADTLSGGGGNDTLAGLGGCDLLQGADGKDRLDGGAGDDRLEGGESADTLVGGAGDDTYLVDDVLDVVTEAAGEGTDTVIAAISYILGDHAENLVLVDDADLSGTGNGLDNTITGNAGSNTLDGVEGTDTLVGGAGYDTYVVDNAGDVVTEAVDEGIDTVRASISYTLGDHVERLELEGDADLNGTGNGLDNTLTGNGRANTLDGLAGSDRLEGAEGDDVLLGGEGSDLLYAGSGNDTLEGGAGNDTMSSDEGDDALFGGDSNDFLQAGDGNDTLEGGAGVDYLDAGAGDDILAGGDANDDLYGRDGNDTLAGGAGRDYIYGGNSGDELAGEGGNDLLAGENGNDTLTGEDGHDTLYGGAGDDTLDGGAGDDSLTGWTGDDIYVVDAAGDVVTEAADSGLDTVRTSIGYVLGDHVENLTLTGSDSVNGTGNALDNHLTGNAGANTLDGAEGADTLVGGAGNDTYIMDDANDMVTELAGGGYDTMLVAISTELAAHVEALVLTGGADLNLTGNTKANRLTGNRGANTLDGAEGADTLIGGAGDDTYIVDNPGDVIVETVNGGFDTMIVSTSTRLASNVEALLLIGSGNISLTGNDLANALTGNAGANTIEGLGGDDTLDGGTGLDVLCGGRGDDVYIVDRAGEAQETALTGFDIVRASLSYTLGANLEALVLLGVASLNGIGNGLWNTLVGNAAANTLQGLGGNDTLAGEAGLDVLRGGLGDDTYVVDQAGEAQESVGQGTDTVRASVNYVLGDNIEHLVLLGSPDRSGTGNALANLLTGNEGANTLSGLAGNDTLDGRAGVDVLLGGLGNDTFVVDAAGEAQEQAAQGTDTVRSSVSYTLGDNLEALVMLGTGDLSGTGNGLANTLTGNAGANRLDGGAGADTLLGGLGDDTYVVDRAGEAQETAGQGFDTVRASASHTLENNIEALVLLGSNNLSGTGNGLSNRLTGNEGANTLNGGLGADVLTGGAGSDVFVLNTLPTASNGPDRIEDMNEAGNDTIWLENRIFTALGAATGALSAAAFQVNDTGLAQDSSDRIILEQDTGEIYYDSNGSASGGTYLLLALVDPGITLTADDFRII